MAEEDEDGGGAFFFFFLGIKFRSVRAKCLSNTLEEREGLAILWHELGAGRGGGGGGGERDGGEG